MRFVQAGLIDTAGALVPDWRAAFARLQPLTKAELRTQPGLFLADASDIVYRGQTSGSGGTALTYFAGQGWNQRRIQARQRSLAWWGFDPATPMVNLASRLSPVRPQDISLVGPIDNVLLEALLHRLATQPLILRGYPSRLVEVAIALNHRSPGPVPHPPLALIATGECLYEAQRSLLHRTFQAPVINEYGSQETGISGLSCPEAGRLHLDGDRCYYEVINGELLTTDLHNLAMPLVRYSGGDVLRFDQDACPCGRSGPTATVLGRQEEGFRLNNQQRWPGEFDLPSFPDLLGYQIQLAPQQWQLWAQLATSVDRQDGEAIEAAIAPLQAWLGETLGDQATQIWVEAAPEPGLDSGLSGLDSEAWLDQVLHQPWSSWLDTPLPLGEAEDMAALLRQLVAPRQIQPQGLPEETLHLVRQLAQAPPAQSPALEALRLRLLLWATGLMAAEVELAQEAQGRYPELLVRFRLWHDRPQSAALGDNAGLGFDLLAPLLTFGRELAQVYWPEVRSLIQASWPQGIRADALTLHHYLAILDPAGRVAQRRPHPWLPALGPLSAVLLGDLQCLGRDLDLCQVALWAELVHHCPGSFTAGLTPATPFRAAWQALRQQLLQQDSAAGSGSGPARRALARLFDLAESPPQLAQCWLEQAYCELLWGESLEGKGAIAWTEVLRQQIGLGGFSPGAGSTPTPVNPMPWLPLLRALAPPLLAAGRPELAYSCLFAAAPPNRYLANCDRQARGHNGKQSILV